VNDYSPQLPFVDIFKSSREWFTQCQVGNDPGCTSNNSWDTGESALLDLDAAGWVRSLPSRSAAPVFTSAATYWDIPAQFPSGTYIVLYAGEGTIEYGLGASFDASRSRHGRDVISVDPTRGGILLRITSTDPNNTGSYIKNIRVVAETDETLASSTTFAQSFLDRLHPYQALRFMDWMQTNNSVVSSWGSRATPSDARYSTARGVPLEIMAQLANLTDKAPWFTLPHQGDNGFVRLFAETTKASLKATLPVYVEYSNEVWNDVFSQGAWIQAQGEAAWPGGTASGFTKRINFYGRRAAEICDIWRDVFSDSPGRVICITASQAANSWTASEALTCPLWDQGPCVTHGITALAIAPYMGDYIGTDQHVNQLTQWTTRADKGLGPLFSELQSGSQLSQGPPGGALNQSFGWITENSLVAQQHSIALIAYEGGQHLVGVGSASNNAAITTLFTAANRDSQMESLYNDYLNGWNARGGGLFMHFTDIGAYSVFGSWGALEEIGQQSSPKYKALWRYGLGTEPPTSDRTGGTRVRLTIHRVGAGTVTSSPAGIRCGSTCSMTVARGARVVLTAKPARNTRFKGWSRGCRHSRPRCSVVMSAAKDVRARFVRRP
jgi:hypothetical protein